MKPRKDISEEQLIREVKAGDNRAMKMIYTLHSGYLLAVSTRYVRDPEDAKDILQDSFIKIFQRIDSFTYRGHGSFRAWASRIVVNEAISFSRKMNRILLLDTEVDIPDTDPDEEADVDEVPAEVIHRLISQLPDGYRLVFNLFAIERKSHKEIAEILGIKENSSASQYFRAKKLLATWLNEYKAKSDER